MIKVQVTLLSPLTHFHVLITFHYRDRDHDGAIENKF